MGLSWLRSFDDTIVNVVDCRELRLRDFYGNFDLIELVFCVTVHQNNHSIKCHN